LEEKKNNSLNIPHRGAQFGNRRYSV